MFPWFRKAVTCNYSASAIFTNTIKTDDLFVIIPHSSARKRNPKCLLCEHCHANALPHNALVRHLLSSSYPPGHTLLCIIVNSPKYSQSISLSPVRAQIKAHNKDEGRVDVRGPRVALTKAGCGKASSGKEPPGERWRWTGKQSKGNSGVSVSLTWGVTSVLSMSHMLQALGLVWNRDHNKVTVFKRVTVTFQDCITKESHSNILDIRIKEEAEIV